MSITLLTALYRRRIPALTMTVARRGTPLRECAEIIKNDAHRVFTALIIRGFVPHARQSCAGVEETGHSHRFLWVDAIPFWIIPMPFMQGLYQTFVMAFRLTGPPGGVACHGAGASRKKASFCISMAAAACLVIY